jgi:hypothetical protein
MLMVLAPRFEFRLHRNRSVYSTAQNRYLEQEVYLAGNLSASLLRILVCALKKVTKVHLAGEECGGSIFACARPGVALARLFTVAPLHLQRSLFFISRQSAPARTMRHAVKQC